MELSKIQKAFLLLIFIAVSVSLYVSSTNNNKQKPVNMTANTTAQTGSSSKGIISNDLTLSELKNSLYDLDEEITKNINEHASVKKELEKEKASLALLDSALRETETTNIFNKADWYNPISLYNAYQGKQALIKEKKEAVAQQSEKVLKLELNLESLEASNQHLKSKKESLLEIMQKIADEDSSFDFGVINSEIEVNSIKKIEKETLQNEQSKDRFSSIEKMIKADAIKEVPASVKQKGKIVENLPPFIIPVKNYTVTSDFGYRIHPIYGNQRFHSGTDLGVDYGEPVVASNYGLVVYSGWYSGFGYTVILSHAEGVYTLYGHNSELKVDKGELVKQGQLIALAGSTGNSTGPHCHFSMWIDNELVNPMDNIISN